MKHNVPDFSLVVDGIDYASTIVPRLISLTLSEKLEDGADELEITLSNHDGQLAPIKRGVFATFRLGWKSGPDVTPGLVDKGKFKIDQIVKSGPPDVLKITARSADLTGAMRKRKDKGWKGKTLQDIIGDVASANGLEAKVHADLAGIQIPSAEQATKSDIAFVRDLGRRYDAVATVKDGKLLFMPIGSDTNAAGQSLGAITLTRKSNVSYSFTIADREDHDGAEAQWHDKGEARKRTVKHGEAKNPKRIKRNFASEAEAKDATKAEAKRAARGQFTFSYELGLGDATIEPNRKAVLQDFDTEIDGITWLVKEVTHKLEGSGGFGTSIELESTK
ncbi:contractile injection system protein, VgrG/Pvc8 family [Novosphingobium aquae]|uniref:Contractile injection system protein, VgrG/Pvc8 family n=1 Tax=Novosphingobium aquae TaxID=3133435 RepID=A0ABU8S538_9SPHN